MSGVNWMRRNSSPSARASAAASSVFATPGTPSSSTWPPSETAASSRRGIAPGRRRPCSTSAATASYRSLTRRSLPAAQLGQRPPGGEPSSSAAPSTSALASSSVEPRRARGLGPRLVVRVARERGAAGEPLARRRATAATPRCGRGCGRAWRRARPRTRGAAGRAAPRAAPAGPARPARDDQQQPAEGEQDQRPASGPAAPRARSPRRSRARSRRTSTGPRPGQRERERGVVGLAEQPVLERRGVGEQDDPPVAGLGRDVGRRRPHQRQRAAGVLPDAGLRGAHGRGAAGLGRRHEHARPSARRRRPRPAGLAAGELGEPVAGLARRPPRRGRRARRTGAAPAPGRA